jgi:acid phosphatase
MKSTSILSAVWVVMSLFSCCAKNNTVIPRPEHLLIVIEENRKYSQIVGSLNAPYITAVCKEAAVFTNSFAVTHPSQPNYLAFFSGSQQNITDDRRLDSITPFVTPNLGAALIREGFTFKGYAQNLPSVGSKIYEDSISALTGGVVYGRKHCPWVNWQGDGKNNFPDSLSRPMTDFPKDFNQLPDVAFVIPDMDHDMHNLGGPGGEAAATKRGDDWLKENLGEYIEWAKMHNSLLLLTFDEDDGTPVNRILTLFAGQQVKSGKYSKHINHYDVLRTIGKIYGLPPCANDSAASAIVNAWK